MLQVDKEASLKDIMAAAAPLAGLDPDSERFVAGNLRDGALHVAFLQDSFKVGGGWVFGCWDCYSAASLLAHRS